MNKDLILINSNFIYESMSKCRQGDFIVSVNKFVICFRRIEIIWKVVQHVQEIIDKIFLTLSTKTIRAIGWKQIILSIIKHLHNLLFHFIEFFFFRFSFGNLFLYRKTLKWNLKSKLGWKENLWSSNVE